MISTVRGRFGAVSGTAAFSGDDDSQAGLDVTIDAGRIDTHEDKRDAHVRSADFLDEVKIALDVPLIKTA